VIAVRGTSHADLEARFMAVYMQEGPPILRGRSRPFPQLLARFDIGSCNRTPGPTL
jgi:hypothetical protein